MEVEAVQDPVGSRLDALVPLANSLWLGWLESLKKICGIEVLDGRELGTSDVLGPSHQPLGCLAVTVFKPVKMFSRAQLSNLLKI